MCAKLVFEMNAMCRGCGKAYSISSFEFAKRRPAEGAWRDDRSHGDPVTRASPTGATTEKWPVEKDGTGPSVLGCHTGTARERAGAEDGVLYLLEHGGARWNKPVSTQERVNVAEVKKKKGFKHR